jgi:RimJ/RimL family protein N-acetyltransferase
MDPAPARGQQTETPPPVLTTERLLLRQLCASDAQFLVELLNEPAWLRFIGDRGVRTEADAWRYALNGPVASYARRGFGLYLVALRASSVPIGICGLVKRDTLVDVDIGFAFLERFWSRGYARESASAVLRHARSVLGMQRIVAITAPDNQGSIAVLERIGLRFERMLRLRDDGGESKLFASDG